MFGLFKKKYSSRELKQSYGEMSSLQKEHYDKLTTKFTNAAITIIFATTFGFPIPVITLLLIFASVKNITPTKIICIAKAPAT